MRQSDLIGKIVDYLEVRLEELEPGVDLQHRHQRHPDYQYMQIATPKRDTKQFVIKPPDSTWQLNYHLNGGVVEDNKSITHFYYRLQP